MKEKGPVFLVTETNLKEKETFKKIKIKLKEK